MFYIFINFFLGREQDSIHTTVCTALAQYLYQDRKFLEPVDYVSTLLIQFKLVHVPFGQIKCTVRLISSPDQPARKRLYN